MAGLLHRRVAFVTGGARGIGFAVAQRYLAEGARVMIGDVREDEAAASAARLGGPEGGAHAVGLDVTDADSVDAALATCEAALGVPDVMVANAGVLLLRPVVETPPAEWRRVLEVNLTGAFLCCRAFARAMTGEVTDGRIIVTSSLFGRRGGRENGAYSASKFGVIGLVESLAAELAPHGILVNAVCPGLVDTAMLRQLFHDRAELRGVEPEAVAEELLAKVPLGRLAREAEVADVFVHLASPLARYVTGQALVVDGGAQVGW